MQFLTLMFFLLQGTYFIHDMPGRMYRGHVAELGARKESGQPRGDEIPSAAALPIALSTEDVPLWEDLPQTLDTMGLYTGPLCHILLWAVQPVPPPAVDLRAGRHPPADGRTVMLAITPCRCPLQRASLHTQGIPPCAVRWAFGYFFQTGPSLIERPLLSGWNHSSGFCRGAMAARLLMTKGFLDVAWRLFPARPLPLRLPERQPVLSVPGRAESWQDGERGTRHVARWDCFRTQWYTVLHSP